MEMNAGLFEIRKHHKADSNSYCPQEPHSTIICTNQWAMAPASLVSTEKLLPMSVCNTHDNVQICNDMAVSCQAGWLESDAPQCLSLWSILLWHYSSDVIGCRGSKDNKKLRCQETASLGPEFIAGVMDCLVPREYTSLMHQKLYLLEKSGSVTRIRRRGPVTFSCLRFLLFFTIVFLITLFSQLHKQ